MHSPLDVATIAEQLSDDTSTYPTSERWCPTGSHWLPELSFAQQPNGKLHRDCKRCEAARANRLAVMRAERLPMTGVDIDAIHCKWRRS